LAGQSLPDLPLPSGWGKNVKSAVLQVISLAHYAIISAHGWAANALNPRARQAAEMDRLINDVARAFCRGRVRAMSPKDRFEVPCPFRSLTRAAWFC